MMKIIAVLLALAMAKNEKTVYGIFREDCYETFIVKEDYTDQTKMNECM